MTSHRIASVATFGAILFCTALDAQEFVALDLDKATTLSLADVDEPSARWSVSVIKSETVTRQVPVMRTRQETRTRMVQQNGKPVETTYTVSVPYTEQVEQAFTRKMISLEERIVPLSELKVWSLDRRVLAGEDLVEKCADQSPAIIVSKPWRDGLQINPAHMAVLRPDVLIIYAKPKPTNQSALRPIGSRRKVRSDRAEPKAP